MPVNKTYRGNGKLLLSGEYVVLEGALALGLPLLLGQSLSLKESPGSEIIWESYLPNGDLWFEGKFDLFGFECLKTSNEAISTNLTNLFEACVRLNSDFLSKWKKYKVKTHLDFDPSWGLGSSSTLVSCLAQWADVDPFELLQNTFGGSGYDIACAQASAPIFFQIEGSSVEILPADFSPSFKDHLYFVYLEKKSDSRKAVSDFHGLEVDRNTVDSISEISKELSRSSDLKSFNQLISEHEHILSRVLHANPIKSEFFSNYWGEMKSLGAWGGDFALATSDRSPSETKTYFQDKGLAIILPFKEIVLSGSEVALPNLS
jgi:mevalonate kinase